MTDIYYVLINDRELSIKYIQCNEHGVIAMVISIDGLVDEVLTFTVPNMREFL